MHWGLLNAVVITAEIQQSVHQMIHQILYGGRENDKSNREAR
jgi:hypothetical protein